MRIAILQKDAAEYQKISQPLERVGFRCHAFSEFSRLMADLRSENFDLAVIEWEAPDGHASEIDRLRHASDHPLPILFTTVPSVGDETVASLIDGVSDYVAKPLRQTEIIARIQALLLRTHPATMTGQHNFGPYVFDPVFCQVQLPASAGNSSVTLTQKEFTLALLMFRNADRPLSRSYIRDEVWGRGVRLSSRTMDTHISRIRHKLDLGTEHRFRIEPVYGYGYRLDDIGSRTREPDRLRMDAVPEFPVNQV